MYFEHNPAPRYGGFQVLIFSSDCALATLQSAIRLLWIGERGCHWVNHSGGIWRSEAISSAPVELQMIP